MKTVEFLGESYEVPNWANYITSDEFGVVVWEAEPFWEETEWLDHLYGNLKWLSFAIQPMDLKVKIY